MWTGLERYRDLGLLVARLGFGLGFFWYHGYAKLTGGPETWAAVGGAMRNFGITLAPEWWGFAAALAEGVGGLMIALGLFFRPTALALTFVMIVAATNHIVSGQGTPAHAFKNAWLFAGLIFVGPGRYSVDHVLQSRAQASAAPAVATPLPSRR